MFENSQKTPSGSYGKQLSGSESRLKSTVNPLPQRAVADRVECSDLFTTVPSRYRARFSHQIKTNFFLIATACRPAQIGNISRPLVDHFASLPLCIHSAHSTQVAQIPRARSYACLQSVASLLGAAIAIAMDSAAILVAVIALPFILLPCAVKAAEKRQGLKINSNQFDKVELSEHYNEAICDVIGKFQLGNHDALSPQLQVDLPRQNMYVEDRTNFGDLTPLSKSCAGAIGQLRDLCRDESGNVDQLWLLAYTEMCAQGLLNGVVKQIKEKQVITFAGLSCIPDFNGETFFVLSREFDSGAATVRAQVDLKKGLRVCVDAGANVGELKEDPTPLRLFIEVSVAKGQKESQMPSVNVRNLGITPI